MHNNIAERRNIELIIFGRQFEPPAAYCSAELEWKISSISENDAERYSNAIPTL